MKNKQDLLRKLDAYGACNEAVAWVVASKKRTARAVWEDCPRGDWLLWLAHKSGVETKQLVRAACASARTVLKNVPRGEMRPLQAIEAAEGWCDDRVPIDEVRAAAYSAASAARSAAASAYSAYSAAWSAAASADSAAYSAAASAYSAAASADSAAASAAGKRNQQKTAHLVRAVISWEEVNR